MKQILNEWNKFVLNETSINRVRQHMMENETAFITAYRNDTEDYTKCRPNHSKNDKNKSRNKELKAVLMERGYGVTSVMGSYVEGFGTKAAKEVKEHSFFVVNLSDDPNFKEAIFKLSEFYCQDSFLYVPQGGKDALLIGTNDDDFPGYGVESNTGDFLGGFEGQFMSRVGKRGRPVKFTEGLETKSSKQNNTKHLISTLAEKVTKEMEDKKNK
jgi:hypothetical protein